MKASRCTGQKQKWDLILETNKYPTTCAELREMISAEWPSFGTTDTAIVLHKDGEQNFYAVARYITSSGLREEGQPTVRQLYFSEEEAVRALWWHYQKTYPCNQFETGNRGVKLYWREYPEAECHNGVWRAIMRIACVWRAHNGETVVTSNPYAQNTVAA